MSTYTLMRERIVDAVRMAGELIRPVWGVRDPSEKGSSSNLVTRYDVALQELLEKRLSEDFPDAAFLGEEEKTHVFKKEGRLFVIDPIDGTSNFVFGYGMSAVSVALLEDGVPVVGVVYNPYIEQMYTAVRGEGAYMNGERIHVSTRPLRDSLAIYGSSPYNAELRKQTLSLLGRVADCAADVRRLGSAALDLCHVAAGRASLFFELHLSPWDYAAGSLILTEAGGVVTDLGGNALPYDRPSGVLAGTLEGHAVARDLFQ